MGCRLRQWAAVVGWGGEYPGLKRRATGQVRRRDLGNAAEHGVWFPPKIGVTAGPKD